MDYFKKIVKYKRLSFVQFNLLSLMKLVFFFQVYKVVVNFGEEFWFIFRRYNEFYSFYEKVSLFILFFWGGGGGVFILFVLIYVFFI